MAVFNNILAGASGQTAGGGPAVPADIERSLRINSADGAYLYRTPGSPGNRRTWTLSFWAKLTGPYDGTDDYLFRAYGSGSSQLDYFDLRWQSSTGNLRIGGYSTAWRSTTALFRDPSAWYHIVLTWDTSQLTPADRVKLYVNGVKQTAFDYSSDPGLNNETSVNNTVQHVIGVTSNFLIADCYLIDGQALTADDFGASDETTGAWNPIVYSGSYGTNGFHLDFADNSSITSGSNVGIGKDTSGKGNYWNSTNISVTAGAGNDSLFDSPTNGTQTDTGAGGEVSGNYATWNPLNTSTYTFANGNLDSTGYAPTNQMTSTIGVSSGKWYAEFVVSGSGGMSNTMIGISQGEQAYYPGQLSTSYGYIAGTGQLYNSGSPSSYASTYTYGDVIGVALNMDAGTLTYYKNGSSLGQAASGLSGTYFFACRGASATDVITGNWGQRAYSYSAPSGFKALCTGNFDTPTIEDPSTAMDIRLWDVTSSETMNMSPDLIWMKRRNSTGNHAWVDTVRSRFQHLESDNINPETRESTPYISSFNSDGFSLNSGTVFNNGNSFVGWCWEGGHPATAATGAVAFDGTGDYLRISASTDFSFGTPSGNTNDFTIEWFQYWYDLTSYQTIWSNNYVSSPGILVQTGNGDGKYRVFLSSGTVLFQETNAPRAGQWYHYALVRNGTTLTIYRNGVANGSATSSSAAGNGTAVADIGQGNGSFYLKGVVSNFRVIKGTALYTSNFTPPTSALTNVTNTKLLCAQSETLSGISDPAVAPSYDINVKSSNSGSGSVGALTAITSSGNYYYDTPSGGPAWIQLDFASTQSSVTSIKLSGGGFQAGSTFDLYVNGVLVENDRATQSAWAEDTIAISSTNINSIKIEGSDGYSIGALKFNNTLVSGSIGGILANGNTLATSFNPLDRFSVNGTGYSTTGAAGITEGPIVKLTGASVNRNAGFSIVTYTSTSNNTTVGHGLTEKPALIIVRNRFKNYSWMVYSEALGATKYLILQERNAAATNIDRWNNTEPTSSVFTIGTNAQVNGDCVAYCFAPVDGFSAFGTYVANGLADGPFVCCNFRPKVVILKKTDTLENWIILDATRDSYNETVANLFPNRDLAEQASAKIDLLANGFKLRSTTTGGNTTGGTYLYAAFAENPFKYARAR